MSNMMKTLGTLTVGIAVGAAAVWVALPYIGMENGDTSKISGEPEPLYWVAPMDPNYRRDKPGKSPMGMDLIPVFEEANQGTDSGPGTISVAPEMINNLGVRIGEVVKQPLSFKIRTVGYVQYNQDKVTHIHPRVDGWIEKSFVRSKGEQVTKGEPLYEIYSPLLVNAQEELLFALARNDSRLVKAAEARLKALQVSDAFITDLRKNRKAQQYVTFKAPVSGVVDDFNLSEGMYVKPGTTLLSVASLDEMWVEAEVFERQAALLKEGLVVTLESDFQPGVIREGRVDYIYPELNAKTRTLKVRLRFANEDHALKPNMFARVVIENPMEKAVLTVPQEAVIRTGNVNRVVIALGEGRFKSVEVKTGQTDGQLIEVLSGLNEEDRIVTAAQFMLDSESSKTSDFKRMSPEASEPEKPSSVWVEATLISSMPGHRMLTLKHAPIEAWGWPTMTMDFTLDEQVEMPDLPEGSTLHVEIKDKQGQFPITGIHIPDTQGTAMPEMDHSAHQGMNHEAMPEMDHSAHQGMNHQKQGVGE
jgi:Cu(I)/Ag(I) efflux system membrane fusion protein